MTQQIYYYLDRTLLNELPVDLSKQLTSKGYFTKSDDPSARKATYCGLLQTKEALNVFLPRASSITCNRQANQTAGLLFRALRKASKKNLKFDQEDTRDDQIEGIVGLGLIYEILDYYRQYGIYTHRTTEYKRNKGRINWKKTIAKTSPVIANNGVLYMEYLGRQRRHQSDSETSRIHAYVVAQLDRKFSSILFGSSIFRDHGLPTPSSLSKVFLVATLHKELQDTYSDRDIRLIKSLISFLQSDSDINATGMAIGTSKFHNLWEHMLSETLTHTVSLNDKIPAPAYTLRNSGRKIVPSKNQRTDIILEDKRLNFYAVVDAKYYDSNSLSAAPGWKDLVKQFFYRKALQSLFPNSMIMNCFMFPGPENQLVKAEMLKRDTQEVDEEYGEIHCLYLEPEHVLKSYSEGSKIAAIHRDMVALHEQTHDRKLDCGDFERS